MVSLDYRTRTEASIRPVDTRAFFDEELPALIADRSALAIAARASSASSRSRFVTPAGAWTLALERARV